MDDQAGPEVPELTAEEVIDHYYQELINTETSVKSNASGSSFNQQIDDYRVKQATKYKEGSANSVTLLGDSMVKRIKGQKLSQSKMVTVISRPGAKIDDLSTMIMDGSIVIQTSELIVHVGTNNTRDDAETISTKIESLCEMAQVKFAIRDITISSIIHRHPENRREHDKIVSVNILIRQICCSYHWKLSIMTTLLSDCLPQTEFILVASA